MLVSQREFAKIGLHGDFCTTNIFAFCVDLIVLGHVRCFGGVGGGTAFIFGAASTRPLVSAAALLSDQNKRVPARLPIAATQLPSSLGRKEGTSTEEKMALPPVDKLSLLCKEKKKKSSVRNNQCICRHANRFFFFSL